MSDINFLDNKQQRGGDDEKLKGDKKQKLIWSNPKAEVKGAKSSVFSFLPFADKKKLVSAVDKNKIKRSREEILNLIKHQENSKPQARVKSKNFLRTLGEKLKRQPAPKEALIDYQRVFNREKEHKNQVGEVLKVEPAFKAAEKPPLIPPLKRGRGGVNWLSRLRKLFKNKMTRPAGIIKFVRAEKTGPAPVQPAVGMEKKTDETKEIKLKEPAPLPQAAARPRVLETNLMQGELVTFFDWRSKIIILAGAILAPFIALGAVYYGLTFYQKSSQAKNSAQEQKFSELRQEIAEAEAGLKDILAFQSRLKTVSEIFGQHLYWTNFFKFLEDNTIKDVYFVNFSGDTGGHYALDALTASYGSIVEQVKVFGNNEKITAVLVSGGELVSGDDKNKSLVKFVLDFSILKTVFTE